MGPEAVSEPGSLFLSDRPREPRLPADRAAYLPREQPGAASCLLATVKSSGAPRLQLAVALGEAKGHGD